MHNKGLVATVFTTQITECSSPLEVNGKHTEAIGPYASATFLFKLRLKEQGIRNGISSCKGEASRLLYLIVRNCKVYLMEMDIIHPVFKSRSQCNFRMLKSLIWLTS